MKHMAEGQTDEEAATLEEAKPKRHIIFDHPLLTTILSEFVLMFAYQIPAAILAAVGIPSVIANLACCLAVCFLALLLYRAHFRGAFDGVLGWSTHGLLLVLPALPLFLINFTELFGGSSINPLWYAILSAMVPGVFEEVAFRGIPVANWMRRRGNGRDMAMAIFWTSALFGLTHSLNIISGAPLSTTLFQVAYAFGLGVLLSAVLLSTGSLWPCMVMHTAIDFSAFLFMPMETGGVITEELSIDLSFWIISVACIVMVGFAISYLRPANRDRIKELWGKKWSRA